MRKYLYSLLIVMGTSTMPLVAQECCDACKLYLNPQDVMVSQNGIIVNIDGMAGITDTITHDINGLYTDSNRVLWIDSNGHFVRPENPKCPQCGERQNGREEREREQEARKNERERKMNEHKEREKNNKK